MLLKVIIVLDFLLLNKMLPVMWVVIIGKQVIYK